MGNNSGKPVVFTDEGMFASNRPYNGSFAGRITFIVFALQPRPITLNANIWISAVNLNHFRLLRVVGKGAFGKVRIVERKDTGLTFALKYIRKDEGI
jgi:hypothetical protein